MHDFIFSFSLLLNVSGRFVPPTPPPTEKNMNTSTSSILIDARLYIQYGDAYAAERCLLNYLCGANHRCKHVDFEDTFIEYLKRFPTHVVTTSLFADSLRLLAICGNSDGLLVDQIVWRCMRLSENEARVVLRGFLPDDLPADQSTVALLVCLYRDRMDELAIIADPTTMLRAATLAWSGGTDGKQRINVTGGGIIGLCAARRLGRVLEKMGPLVIASAVAALASPLCALVAACSDGISVKVREIAMLRFSEENKIQYNSTEVLEDYVSKSVCHTSWRDGVVPAACILPLIAEISDTSSMNDIAIRCFPMGCLPDIVSDRIGIHTYAMRLCNISDEE